MVSLLSDDGEFPCKWASDVNFEGLRLEVLTGQGAELFEVAIPERGGITINTFGRDVPASLIKAAIKLAEQR